MAERVVTAGCVGPLVIRWTDEGNLKGTLDCASCKYQQPIGGFCDAEHWGLPISGPGQGDA